MTESKADSFDIIISKYMSFVFALAQGDNKKARRSVSAPGR